MQRPRVTDVDRASVTVLAGTETVTIRVENSEGASGELDATLGGAVTDRRPA